MLHRRSACAALLALLLLLSTAVVQAQEEQEDLEDAAVVWTAAARADVTLHHTQGDDRTAALADHAQGAHDLVSDLLQLELPGPLTVIVWPTGADPSDPAQFPPTADPAAADGPLQHVFRSTSGAVRSAVTDAFINLAAAPHADAVPLWLRSALGLWSAGPLPGFFLTRAGSVVIYDHEHFYTLPQLETIPQSWQFQAKYFGQAGGMLSWMLQDWGAQALIQLFAAVADGVEFYAAFEQVYGIPKADLIPQFTNNAERALLLLWPYTEPQNPPFYERLNVNHIIAVAAAIPGAILLFFVAKRLFYD